MTPPAALFTVATFDTVAEALVVQALLDADGIDVTMLNAGLIGLDWSFSQALGGIRLVVRQPQAERAAVLLRAYRDNALTAVDETGAPPPVERCERCGSDDIVIHAPRRRSALLVAFTLIFDVMFPVRSSLRSCRACGHRWSVDD